MKILLLSGLLLCAALFNQCNTPKKIADSAVQTTQKKVKLTTVPYNIHDVDGVMTLAAELREISGLAYDPESETLLCVNDELGFIYRLDTQEGKIQSKRNFGSIGDYEGIAFYNDDLIITRSNGKFSFYDSSVGEVYKIVRTPLNTQNNIEGIIYDKSTDKILLACKGSPRIAGKIEETKGKLIIAYDVSADTLESVPYLLIKDKQLEQKVSAIYKETGLNDLQIQQLQKRVESFAPSGLAIHPLSGDLYILSAKRSLLVVVDQQKDIKHIHFLDEKVHIQPEGIAFTPTGDMYIGNEGKSGTAKIYYYKYQL